MPERAKAEYGMCEDTSCELAEQSTIDSQTSYGCGLAFCMSCWTAFMQAIKMKGGVSSIAYPLSDKEEVRKRVKSILNAEPVYKFIYKHAYAR
jgi:hypothetical protein